MSKPQIKVVFSNERLITPSGLNIVGGMLGKSNFVKRCNRIPVDKKRSEPQIKDGDVLLTYIGLLCQALHGVSLLPRPFASGWMTLVHASG